MTNRPEGQTLLQIETGSVRADVDRNTGVLRRLVLTAGDREIEALHTAPWASEAREAELSELAPVERALAGDFFCAPFGSNDVEPGPIHGPTANTPWRLLSAGDGTLEMELDQQVLGATVQKSVRLGHAAPVLCQQHRIQGGAGRLPVAHHPMVHMAAGGTFSTSAKRLAMSPEVPLEPGRNRLACPARTEDLSAFPAANGSTVDLHRLPIADGCEDFVLLVEAAGNPLGWSAVVRDAEDDVVLVLRDPKTLPVTMLWHSNGGRDYAPWDGRHRGVLGIEDGCAPGAGGHSAALGPNAVSAVGVPDALDLAPGKVHRIAHAIVAFPRPEGWRRVTDVSLSNDQLKVTDVSGGVLTFDSDPAFSAVGF
ncbi:hypothetical protein [Tropicimonas isoalkanivorans]|uniref:Aldose 1-epimerase n=1 Tax=Tropicimonas isoalkanivorans TaxID=441112 RepID=A0A1I1R403_9RHOB|nr:hypothetical protein [Tropicimonas isoalkanivorans]SFD28992.1 hypothetical protein SAMN04488094_12715 [Tropicimonas isoalkanivorans]